MHEVIAEVAGNLIPVDVQVSAGEAIPVEVAAGGGGGGGGGGNYETASVSYTPTESQQTDEVTPSAGYDALSKVDVTVDAIPSNYVGSGVDRNDSTDMMISENNPPTVLAPAGYYASDATLTVPAGTAGTPVAVKGTVTSNSVTVTPKVTNSAGWVGGGTTTGTAVVVTASELVSGDKAITENGNNIDVTNYETVSVNVSGGGAPVTIASGSFTGTDGNAVDLNLGTDGPIKNFYCLIEVDSTEAEYAYNTNYKVVQSRVFVDNDHPLVYQGHSSDYDYYCAAGIPITVNNSGTITSHSIWPISEEHQYIRNSTPAAHGALYNSTSPAIRKHTASVTFYYSTGNSQYRFVSGKKYKWKLVYFGNNYSNESVSV